MSGPRGKGRGGKSVTETSSDRQDTRARVAGLPTKQPRPDWMRDPKKLPKEPPGGKRRNDRP